VIGLFAGAVSLDGSERVRELEHLLETEREERMNTLRAVAAVVGKDEWENRLQAFALSGLPS